MKPIKLLIALSAIFFSCIKDSTTRIEAFVSNPTTHAIKINFYKGGIIAKTVAIAPGNQFQIGEGSELGKVGKGGFPSDYAAYTDSVTVIFDDTYRIVHYSTTPLILSSKHYLNTSLRNLMNPDSYDFRQEDIGKNGRRNTYTYTFTEQDYLYAK